MGRGSAVFFLWLIETGDVGQDSSAVTDPPKPGSSSLSRGNALLGTSWVYPREHIPQSQRNCGTGLLAPSQIMPLGCAATKSKWKFRTYRLI